MLFFFSLLQTRSREEKMLRQSWTVTLAQLLKEFNSKPDDTVSSFPFTHVSLMIKASHLWVCTCTYHILLSRTECYNTSQGTSAETDILFNELKTRNHRFWSTFTGPRKHHILHPIKAGTRVKSWNPGEFVNVLKGRTKFYSDKSIHGEERGDSASAQVLDTEHCASFSVVWSTETTCY